MSLKPMLATAAPAPPNEPGWIMEPKFDGWRAITYIDHNGDVKMETRTGSAITTVPYIAEMFSGLPVNTVLDGEIVDLASDRQWNRTQSILSRKKVHVPVSQGTDTALEPTDPPLTYVLFDVLELEGSPLMGEHLTQRRKLLKLIAKLVGEAPRVDEVARVAVVDELACDDPDADAYFNSLVEQGWEGVVCKRLDSTYALGARNGAWLKVKPEAEVDVQVTGTYAPATGSKYEGVAVGGITFEVTHDDGTTYNGRCAGMDDDLREALHTEPEKYVGRVAEVAYASIGDAGALRFPRFKRFRDPADKSVADLTAAIPSNSTGRVLLKRALEAEERVTELEAENADLRIRLGGAVKAAVKPRRASGGRAAGKTRNYKAMDNPKLADALTSLEQRSGDAYARALATEANGGWSVSRHESEAFAVAASRGLR